MTTTGKGTSLQMQMLIGFAIGLAAGLAFNGLGIDPKQLVLTGTEFSLFDITNSIGQIFLRLLFMLVIPLLFAALVSGVAEMGDIAALKRVGLKTLFFTIGISAVAVVIALAVVNLFEPGTGVDPALANSLLASAREGASAIVTTSQEKPAGLSTFINIIPNNVVKAAAENDILAVMFFALVFGIGLLLTSTPSADRLQETIEGIFHVSMKLIGFVIRLAPIAIACFMFNLAAIFGWELLIRLGAYVGVVLLALGLHMFVVYPIALATLGGMSPIKFFKGIQEALVVAFSTASSNATLPTAIRVAEQKLMLPSRVSRFVLTIGATANQNGTAIFEGVTVLFLAQFFNVELTLGQQFVVLLMCILGGIGTAGVPAGSLPVIALILGMVGVPPEGIGLVLGVDRFLDMCRTTLNVAGDLTAAVVVSRGEAADEPAAAVLEKPAPAA